MTQELMLDPTDPKDADGPYGPYGPHLVRDTAPPPVRDLRIVSARPRVDLAAAGRAAAHFLTALAEAARRLGAELGRAFRPAEAGREVEGVLAQQGYEPSRGGDGVIRLRNCPFHQLAEQHKDVVCGMNLALVEGLVAGLGAGEWHPVLDPAPGRCCVAIGGDPS